MPVNSEYSGAFGLVRSENLMLWLRVKNYVDHFQYSLYSIYVLIYRRHFIGLPWLRFDDGRHEFDVESDNTR